MRVVTVNDRMQRGYSYELVAPIGEKFDPEFRPELSPAEMLRLGVFCGKYMTDCRDEFPPEWFSDAKLAPGQARLLAELFRRRCEPETVGVAGERVDLPG